MKKTLAVLCVLVLCAGCSTAEAAGNETAAGSTGNASNMRVSDGNIQYLDESGEWVTLSSVEDFNKTISLEKSFENPDIKEDDSEAKNADLTALLAQVENGTGTVSLSPYGQLLINGQSTGWSFIHMPEETTWPDWSGRSNNDFYEWCGEYGINITGAVYTVAKGMDANTIVSVDVAPGTSTYVRSYAAVKMVPEAGYLHINFVDQDSNESVGRIMVSADAPAFQVNKSDVKLRGYELVDAVPDTMEDGDYDQYIDLKVKETGIDVELHSYYWTRSVRLKEGTYKVSDLIKAEDLEQGGGLKDPDQSITIDYDSPTDDFEVVLNK